MARFVHRLRAQVGLAPGPSCKGSSIAPGICQTPGVALTMHCRELFQMSAGARINWSAAFTPLHPRSCAGRRRLCGARALGALRRTKVRVPFRLPAVLGLWVSFTFAARADDWPQVRGPNRDSVWNETGILQTFPAEGLKIRWRAPVEPGWSSPAVVRGRVYVTDMRLEKPRAWERIQCFKESTGKLIWSREYELVYPEFCFVPEQGGGPAATLIVEAGKVYWPGRSGQVDCLDARSGKVIWEIHLDTKYEVGILSCRGSPLIEGNLLILLAGAKPGACVMALDKQTGK